MHCDPARRAALRLTLALATLGAATTAQTITWTPVGNPTGGTTTRVRYDAEADAFLVGTTWPNSYNNRLTAGAIFRATDRGANWSNITAEITAASPNYTRIRDILIRPGGLILAAVDGGGVFRSTNGGVNWAPSSTGLSSLFVILLAADASGTIYASTQSAGVFASADAGVTWSSASNGLGGLRAISFHAGGNYVLAGTNGGGVYKRVGAGTWQPANAGLSATNVSRFTRAADGRILAATNAGVFASADDAASWSAVAGPFSGQVTGVVAQLPGAILVGSDAGVHRSTDGGANWSPVGAFTNGARLNDVAADTGGRWCAATSAGVFLSDDNGDHWTESNAGLHAQTIYRLVVRQNGTMLAGLWGNGIHRSVDGGATWHATNLTSRWVFSLAESPWGDLFAGDYTIRDGVSDGHAWRSRDDGATWTMIDAGIQQAAMISGFAFGTTGEVWLTAAWNPGGVYRSTNSGDSWSRIGPPQNIPAYCLARSAAGDLYIGSEGREVWRLPFGGSTWTGLGMSQSQQFAIAAAPNGTIYVGQDRNLPGLHRSIDGGQSFAPAPGFPGQECYALSTLPSSEVYAGTLLFGMQRSTSNGASWQAVNAGLPLTMAFTLALGGDGRLYTALPGRGVYRTVNPVDCTPLGDLNHDQRIDLIDLATLLAHFGSTSATGADGDLNGDHAVDLTDLATLLASFGRQCP